jgi:hypothetical protein
MAVEVEEAKLLSTRLLSPWLALECNILWNKRTEICTRDFLHFATSDTEVCG